MTVKKDTTYLFLDDYNIENIFIKMNTDLTDLYMKTKKNRVQK